MRYQLLTTTAAFLLGLSLGPLVMGQRAAPPTGAETNTDLSKDPISIPVREKTDPRGDLLGLTEHPAADPSGEALSKNEDNPVQIELGPVSESEQIRILAARWVNQESLISRLEKRVRGLERQLASLSTERVYEREGAPGPTVEPLPVATPGDRRAALAASGVAELAAEEIVRKQSELELDRLELQDQAIREGWHATDRYYAALRALNSDAVDLRTEIGDQAYDEYMFQTGESNRVKVTSVIQGSSAEQSGLLPGDIIERYGDERIFDFSDLRSATADGVRGEIVQVLIRRGDYLMEAEIVRGPMGVRLEPVSTLPGG